MKTKNEVYLDNAATTQVYDEVVDVIQNSLKSNYYNPSSAYKPAIETEKLIEKARKDIANQLGFNPNEIYFTSGATESNNTIIRGVIEKAREPFNIVTSQIEHPSIMEVMKYYENKGVDVRYIPVDSYGNLNLEELKNNIDENTALVSIMAVNNEIGTILDLEQVKKIIQEKNPETIFHTDFVQALLKVNPDQLDLKKLKPDALSVTAHKIHGPKGVGVLALRNNKKITPLILGGGQERNFRSGTENVSGILAFAKAMEVLSDDLEEKNKYIKELKDVLIDRITNEIEDVTINTPENSISSLVSFSFKNIKSEVLLHMLESKGFFISSGSACSTNHKDSYVHQALNYENSRSDGTIRISLSEFNNLEEINRFIDELKISVKDIRKLLGFK